MIMWSSSNMFFKKLFTNFCFPRSSTTSSSSSPGAAAAAFTTHQSRHCSNPPPHNDHYQKELEDYDDVTNDYGTEYQKHQEATKMMTKNFNTLYASQPSTSKSTTPDDDDDDLSFFFASSSTISDHPHFLPDFATAFASQRFFFSSPGHSKSLIDRSNSNPPPPRYPDDLELGDDDGHRNSRSGPLLQSAGGVPVPKYSPDPYSDFRRSMQEMVEARISCSKDPNENWEYLHQLLSCYLSLNPRNTHECIIKAFSDLVVNLLSDKGTSVEAGAADPPNVGRRRSRRLL